MTDGVGHISEAWSMEDVLSDPTTSYWLKGAIADLLVRDPLDASRDAYLLHLLMQHRLNDHLHPGVATNTDMEIGDADHEG